MRCAMVQGQCPCMPAGTPLWAQPKSSRWYMKTAMPIMTIPHVHWGPHRLPFGFDGLIASALVRMTGNVRSASNGIDYNSLLCNCVVKIALTIGLAPVQCNQHFQGCFPGASLGVLPHLALYLQCSTRPTQQLQGPRSHILPLHVCALNGGAATQPVYESTTSLPMISH